MTEPASSRPDPLRARQVLRHLIERAGDPPTGSSDLALIEELDSLDEVSSADDLERWTKLDRDTQRLWIAYLVARGRALRDRVANVPSLRARLREVLVRFPTFASTTPPGFVNGMSPDHGPQGKTWTDDAKGLLTELQDLAGLRPRLPASTDSARATPRPRKTAESEAGDDDPRESTSRVEPELRQRVAGMRVLLFGGSPREVSRLRLESAFGFGSLDWPESDKPRRLDSVVDAIFACSYDLVLVTRLVHHAESNRIIAAAREAGTPWALVETGYGIEAVRQAVHAALDAQLPSAT